MKDHAGSMEDQDGLGNLGSAELDLKEVMNESPFTVEAHCPLPRVWRLFRTMGLRHLVVLDHDHCVTGIITREVRDEYTNMRAIYPWSMWIET